MALHLIRDAVPATAGPSRKSTRRAGQKGQVVVIFAGAMLALVAMSAVVVDVAWYWTSNLRMQRAADAAALAGVVWLPANPGKASTVAIAEAAKNGYVDGVDGLEVLPEQDADNPRRLKVRIEGEVGTFFAKAVGIGSWPAARAAKADYVLPVPMGSPDNYYGVGYYVKPETVTTTTTDIVADSEDSGARHASDWPQDEDWRASSGTLVDAVGSDDSTYARASANGAIQTWTRFSLLTNLDADEEITDIRGIRVTVNDVRLSAGCSGTTNRVLVQLSWDGGTSWTDATSSTRTPSFSSTTQNDYQIPPPPPTTPTTAIWTASGLDWDDDPESKLSNANFRVRLTAAKGCTTSATQLRVDELIVQVWYDVDRTVTTTTTTTTLIQNAPVPTPTGAGTIDRPQRFWGAMQSKGAPSIQGDIYSAYYDSRTTSSNPFYDPDSYYHYAVEIPAGGGGSVWAFDPGFCDATSSVGTGEYYTLGGANGSSSVNPVSSYFELRNLGADLLNAADDTVVTPAGTSYQGMDYQDKKARTAAGASNDAGTADCGAESWHYGWVLLASGLAEGTYAIHSYSTDTGDPDNQNQQTALNAFAFYASSSSGTPRIYGLGAMEAYVRLPGGQASEFYFAQIERVHAGKTMEINLWDPGDTGNLSADLQILIPSVDLAGQFSYQPVKFKYKGIKVSNSSGVSSSCASQSDQGGNANHVVTNTGGTSLFNGCWLRMEVQLPVDYDAPTDPVSGEDGWWKIRYTMGGNASAFSTDLTTWQVNIRGNPVHLVLP